MNGNLLPLLKLNITAFVMVYLYKYKDVLFVVCETWVMRDPGKRAMRAARQGTKNRLRAALSQPLWPWPLRHRRPRQQKQHKYYSARHSY